MLNCITYIQLHFFLYMLTYQNEGLSLAQRIAVLIAKLTVFLFYDLKLKATYKVETNVKTTSKIRKQ